MAPSPHVSWLRGRPSWRVIVVAFFCFGGCAQFGESPPAPVPRSVAGSAAPSPSSPPSQPPPTQPSQPAPSLLPSASQASPPSAVRPSALAQGLTRYEDGDYGEAANQFQLALEQKLSLADRVRANQHLAFDYCVTGKKRLCGDEFRKLLAVSPQFKLDAAEAGHPVWGPIFRRVKTTRAGSEK